MRKLIQFFVDIGTRINAYRKSGPTMREIIEKHGESCYDIYVRGNDAE